jgi:hypothetical protein
MARQLLTRGAERVRADAGDQQAGGECDCRGSKGVWRGAPQADDSTVLTVARTAILEAVAA